MRIVTLKIAFYMNCEAHNSRLISDLSEVFSETVFLQQPHNQKKTQSNNKGSEENIVLSLQTSNQ